ncbi:DUF484 family protein [Niveibacterium umoris]|uniref:DUF484 domain-containing protein n=1 Tax=Niveibacterium umoris TaxID=1193620 RepID=A0A840BKC1_9RHOO|nr:DUF484 family protein [Niveibacterium umoris]MBB4014001.1 hypothetical protein [Niveibacterium umoris]
MTDHEVVGYLLAHPEFFNEQPALLAELAVPHPDTGQAISLTERQLLAMREKLQLLQDKMAELVRFGEENDVIGEKVHRLTLGLLECNSVEAVVGVIDTHLVEDFAVPHIALRIWNSIIQRDTVEFSPVSEEFRFFAADLRHPYCGPATQPEVCGWFGEAGNHVRSVALLPLRRDGVVFGLLALGSEDIERFYPEMGTLYVARIADLVSASLLNHLG